MPKLPSTTPQQVAKILLKAGFVLVRIRGGHHIFRNTKTGKLVVVPFHKGNLPRGTFIEILRQAGISRDKWTEMEK